MPCKIWCVEFFLVFDVNKTRPEDNSNRRPNALDYCSPARFSSCESLERPNPYHSQSQKRRSRNTSPSNAPRLYYSNPPPLLALTHLPFSLNLPTTLTPPPALPPPGEVGPLCLRSDSARLRPTRPQSRPRPPAWPRPRSQPPRAGRAPPTSSPPRPRPPPRRGGSRRRRPPSTRPGPPPRTPPTPGTSSPPLTPPRWVPRAARLRANSITAGIAPRFLFFFFPPLPWCVSDVARCLVVQSPLLASRSEEYRLLFRLPPDEVNWAPGWLASSDP